MTPDILLLSSDPVVSKQGFLILETLYPPRKIKGNQYSTFPKDILSISIVTDKRWRFEGKEGIVIECVLYKSPFSYPSKCISMKPDEKDSLRKASELCIEWNKRMESPTASELMDISNHKILSNSYCHTIGIEHVVTSSDLIDQFINKKATVHDISGL